jgi:AcrR family transcriptional regulator
MPIDTKIVISETLFELLESKSIDKITVKDIVEVCNVTRQTFYYHFQDIMDVIEFYLHHHMEEFLEESLKANSMEEAMRVLISSLLENIHLVYKLLDSRKREQTEALLFDTMKAYFNGMIDRKELLLDLNRSDMEMTIDFYSHGIVGVLLQPKYRYKSIDVDMVSRQICKLFCGEMFKNKDCTK